MSRARRSFLFALCVLAVSFFVWLDHNYQRQPHSTPQTTAEIVSDDIEKYNAKTFAVIHVVDGDTLDINISDGRYNRTRIRLWGVDTPETKKPNSPVMYFGPEASDFATKIALDKNVTVYLDEKHTRDKYARLLAYIQLPDGRYLNELLLSDGFAYADLRFKHSFYNKYVQLEASARSNKKGLWAGVTREQLPEWLQREKPNLLKKKK
jgi:micrococcal nuclease